jgi:hypothetical protein
LATLRSIWGQRWKLPSSEGGDHPQEVHTTLRLRQTPCRSGYFGEHRAAVDRPTRRGSRSGSSPCSARRRDAQFPDWITFLQRTIGR